MPREDSLSVRIVLAPSRGRRFSLDVSFDALPGVSILFGPSGSGKSTTLAVLAGLIRPSSGRVALGDELWCDTERAVHLPPHRRGVSIVFQSLALFPHLTAAANVEYGIDRSVPRAARMERARAMLSRMKVAQLADRKPATFSGGEAQRVALARAFVRTPRVLLLDEAFSSLDTPLQRELIAETKAMVDELRIPALVVTHNRSEARALGERVLLMEDGRIRRSGKAAELLAGD